MEKFGTKHALKKEEMSRIEREQHDRDKVDRYKEKDER